MSPLDPNQNVHVTFSLDPKLSDQVDRLINLLAQHKQLEQLAARLRRSNDRLAAAVASNTPKTL